MSDLLIRGAIVVDPEDRAARRLVTSDVLVRAGIIQAVAPGIREAGLPTIEASERLLCLPGLVNHHIHAGMSPIIRGAAEDAPRVDRGALHHHVTALLERAYEVLSAEDWEVLFRWDLDVLVRGGTTTVIEESFGHPERFIAAAASIGVRTSVGMTYPSTPSAIGILEDGVLRFAESGELEHEFRAACELASSILAASSPTVTAHLSPHAPDTVPAGIWEETVRAAADLGVGIHAHVSQHLREHDVIASAYGGITPVEFLDRMGVLGPGFLATHVSFASPQDLDLLARSGSTVVHCASRKGREGVTSPFKEVLDRGGRVGIATDSFGHRLLDELAIIPLLSRVRMHPGPGATSTDVFASVFGERPHPAGVVAAGDPADLILLDLRSSAAWPMPDVASLVVNYATSAEVRYSIVEGRCILDAGVVTGISDAHAEEVLAIRERVYDAIA